MAICKTSKDKKQCEKTKLEILRPRTAYNFFYRYQRDLILKSMTVPVSPKENKNPVYDVPDPYSWFQATSRKKRLHRKTHGLIGLQQLTKTVAKRWREADHNTKSIFMHLAEQDKIRYRYENDSIHANTMQMINTSPYSYQGQFQQMHPMGPKYHLSNHNKNLCFSQNVGKLGVPHGIHNRGDVVSCNPITYEYEPLDFKDYSNLNHEQIPDNFNSGCIEISLSNEEYDILHLLLQE